jgi:hypothetical protein
MAKLVDVVDETRQAKPSELKQAKAELELLRLYTPDTAALGAVLRGTCDGLLTGFAWSSLEQVDGWQALAHKHRMLCGAALYLTIEYAILAGLEPRAERAVVRFFRAALQEARIERVADSDATKQCAQQQVLALISQLRSASASILERFDYGAAYATATDEQSDGADGEIWRDSLAVSAMFGVVASYCVSHGVPPHVIDYYVQRLREATTYLEAVPTEAK